MVGMESPLLIPLFLLLQLLASAAATTSTIASATTANEQEFNIVEALASVLSDVASYPFPTKQGATLFVPNDPNGTHNPRFFVTKRDPLIVAYHMVPRRLTYADLRRFPAHTLLPSLLPDLPIEITWSTNSSSFPPSDFIKIGNQPITRPDAMVSRDLVVHGIDSVFPLRAIYDYDSSLVDAYDAYEEIVVEKQDRPKFWWWVAYFSLIAFAFAGVVQNAIHSRRAGVIIDAHRDD
ncbi:hypothetical protein Scep_023133 [Stephania cephalantha]|uniref:FAS1 domain-containing protein n=1 Tax=Stephania cephalantha TaxID=152367 RepID=A0AAP0HSH4_9MAGN